MLLDYISIPIFVVSFILGLIFASISNWYNRNLKSWIVASIYVYFYSTVVMLLKYDVFWFASVFVKLLVPSILVIYFIDLTLDKLRRVKSFETK